MSLADKLVADAFLGYTPAWVALSDLVEERPLLSSSFPFLFYSSLSCQHLTSASFGFFGFLTDAEKADD